MEVWTSRMESLQLRQIVIYIAWGAKRSKMHDLLI
jgi:hypothetical protein